MTNVTIKDVARAAKVSVATVSRAMNGHDNVAAEVRRRVMATAAELRYTPHAAARSLSSRRTHTLGVVLPDLHGEFFSELVRGIDHAAREYGLHLLVSSYHGYPDEQGAAMRAMRGRVDGLLVMSPFVATQALHSDDFAPTLPMVLINTQMVAAGGATLNIDNHGGAMVMVEHLAACGHRRIAFITGPADNFDAHERLRGYRDALALYLPQAREWIVQGDFDEASGHRAGLELAAAINRPEAVFAANDMMALGCLFAFAQAGVRVPEDIALAGFDDIPLARYVHPNLTTMRVNIAALGVRAVRMLHAQMGHALETSKRAATPIPPIEPVTLSAELIVRDSCAAARAVAVPQTAPRHG